MLVLGGDAALFDAGAGSNPIVGGIDHRLQLGVGENAFGNVGANAGNGAALELVFVAHKERPSPAKKNLGRASPDFSQ